MVSWVVPLASACLAALAEWWHPRRCRRIGYLAFGPQGAPRNWTRAVPVLRVAALALATWGLVELLQHQDAGPPRDTKERALLHHLVLCFDISPSMQIEDAGPRGDQRRAKRAAEVIGVILSRIDMRHTRVTAIPFYTTSRPLVVDARDPEVIANILNDLPLEHLFTAGKTSLYSTITGANSVAENWARDSATLLVVSDGDTLPRGQMPELSPAFKQAVVIGIGDQDRGTTIDGHSSRQDAVALREFSSGVRGKYHDANQRHLTSPVVASIVGPLLPEASGEGPQTTDFAAGAILIGSLILAFLNPALALAGSGWKPRLAAMRAYQRAGGV